MELTADEHKLRSRRGLALPDGPPIPLLERVSKKRRTDLFVIWAVILCGVFSLAFYFGTRQEEQRMVRQQKASLELAVGRACIDHTLALRKRKTARSDIEALNIARNCEEIVRRALEKLTWGPQGRENHDTN